MRSCSLIRACSATRIQVGQVPCPPSRRVNRTPDRRDPGDSPTFSANEQQPGRSSPWKIPHAMRVCSVARTPRPARPGPLLAAKTRDQVGAVAAPPLWHRPKCGARLVSRNLWHSCGRFTQRAPDHGDNAPRHPRRRTGGSDDADRDVARVFDRAPVLLGARGDLLNVGDQAVGVAAAAVRAGPRVSGSASTSRIASTARAICGLVITTPPRLLSTSGAARGDATSADWL
jgi:hypothetical protein